jgi:hypothetical protein
MQTNPPPLLAWLSAPTKGIVKLGDREGIFTKQIKQILKGMFNGHNFD